MTEQVVDKRITLSFQELLESSMSSTEDAKALGDMLVGEINRVAPVVGFARRFLNQVEVPDGQHHYVPATVGEHTSIWPGTGEALVSLARQPASIPVPHYYNQAKPFLDAKSLPQAKRASLMESIIDATIIQEDLTWLSLVKALVAAVKDTWWTSPDVTFSYEALRAATDILTGRRYRPAVLLVSNKIWMDMMADDQLAGLMKHRPLVGIDGEQHSCYMGTLLDMSVFSDTPRARRHKVLDNNEFFVIAGPKSHGEYSSTGYTHRVMEDTAIPGVGWSMYATQTMAIAEEGSVVYGCIGE